MPSVDTIPAHKLLERFYSEDDVGAEAALETLLAHVRPQIRHFLFARGLALEDVDDLCGIAMLRLLQALRESRSIPDRRIEDGVAYAKTIAAHACCHDLPHRRSHDLLKRKIVYLLDGRAGIALFARWQIDRDWLGSFVRWRGQQFRPTARYRALCDDPGLFRSHAPASYSPEEMPLPDLLAHLFAWVATPLEIQALTDRVAVLQPSDEVRVVSLEEFAERSEHNREEHLPPGSEDIADKVLDHLVSKQTSARLWQEIGELPPRQRAALLLGMAWEEILLLGITTQQVADALALHADAFLALALELPLSNGAVAKRLEVTPQQVANLRQCARERLTRRREKWEF